eukprot:2587648-Pleurochrysis_carterae.AAC.1
MTWKSTTQPFETLASGVIGESTPRLYRYQCRMVAPANDPHFFRITGTDSVGLWMQRESGEFGSMIIDAAGERANTTHEGSITLSRGAIYYLM